MLSRSSRNTPLASGATTGDGDHDVDPDAHGMGSDAEAGHETARSAEQPKWTVYSHTVRSGRGSRGMPNSRVTDRLITQVTRHAIGRSAVDSDGDGFDFGLGADVVSAMTADGECDVAEFAPEHGVPAGESTGDRKTEGVTARASGDAGPGGVDTARAGAETGAARLLSVSVPAPNATAPIDPLEPYRRIVAQRHGSRPEPESEGSLWGQVGKMIAIAVLAVLAMVVLALVAEQPAAPPTNNAADEPSAPAAKHRH